MRIFLVLGTVTGWWPVSSSIPGQIWADRATTATLQDLAAVTVVQLWCAALMHARCWAELKHPFMVHWIMYELAPERGPPGNISC
jgi:hypothetical protein